MWDLLNVGTFLMTKTPEETRFLYSTSTNDMTQDEGARSRKETGRPAPSLSRKSKKRPSGSAQSSSMSGGNKLKHLKKGDGEPLLRKDLQYDFLNAVFEDDKAVFTNSYEPSQTAKQTFANLYIDTIARSSSTSKVVKDQLLTEHEPAKKIAMVCLLVNLGRLDTTLTFYREMRAQLRTYHAIPSLQAYQDQNSELEDEPRLKSMLKGSERLKSMLNRASKDRPEPNTLENIKVKDIPRTNPVNLIFVLAQFASKVTELHFPPNRDFYDLIMKEDMSSVSRARAFLWLMWFYLESDFTEEGAEENPFGPGVDYDVDVRNQGVPRFDYLTKEEEEAENVDTPEEKEYGFAKMRERKRIIEADQVAFQAEHGPPKRVAKPMLHLPPDDGGPIRIRIALNTGKGRSGPPTTHQLAVERNRNQRVDYTLSRGLRKKHHYARKQRKQEGAFWRALQRTKQMVDPFDDSEGDGELLPAPAPFKARGFGGLVQLESEDDDFGEEMSAYAAAFRRTGRRLDRWDGSKYPNLGVMGTKRASKTNPATVNCHDAVRDADETEDERPPEGNKLRANGDAHMEDDEDLDDMASEVEEDRDTDEDLDDVELLDLGGDEAEEDISDGRMDVD